MSATAETIELLRELVRAACVNTGAPDSGGEIRAVRVLKRYLADVIDAGVVEAQVFESSPGRSSLIARLRGTQRDAPVLGLLGHLDVVPANADRWEHDPFGAELIGDEVWGRGTVDMLYLTAAFAVALRHAALDPEPPRGDLVLLAVADEEAGGDFGVHRLLEEHPDAFGVTEVLCESGGMRMGRHIAIDAAEKGSAGRRLVIHGSPAHASIPYGSNNAAVAAGMVMHHIAEVEPAVELGPLWRPFVEARFENPALIEALLDPVRVDSALPDLGGIAGYAHAASRITISPTTLRSGVAHNVIPGEAYIDLDIRTLPGTDDDDVDAILTEMLRELPATIRDHVEIRHLRGWAATASPIDNPLLHAVTQAIQETDGSPVVPIMAAGGSDAREFRRLGIPSYGFGLLSAGWSYERYRERIHAHNERIDIESVRLTLAALRRVISLRIA